MKISETTFVVELLLFRPRDGNVLDYKVFLVYFGGYFNPKTLNYGASRIDELLAIAFRRERLAFALAVALPSTFAFGLAVALAVAIAFGVGFAFTLAVALAWSWA